MRLFGHIVDGVGSRPRNFPRKHNTMILYWNIQKVIFNAEAIRIPYNPESMQSLAGIKGIKDSKERNILMIFH